MSFRYLFLILFVPLSGNSQTKYRIDGKIFSDLHLQDISVLNKVNTIEAILTNNESSSVFFDEFSQKIKIDDPSEFIQELQFYKNKSKGKIKKHFREYVLIVIYLNIAINCHYGKNIVQKLIVDLL